MDFEALIPFALLLIPGALAQFFYERLRPGTKPDSEFQRILNSFLYGWPVLIANWLVVRWLFCLGNDFNEVAGLFGDLSFFAAYFLSSIVFSFLWACLLTLIRRPVHGLFSYASKLLKQPEIVPELPWDMMFFHNNTQAVEVITPDGNSYKGFVVSTSKDAESGELLLSHADILEDHSECFDQVTRVHVNTQTGVVIREFALDAYLVKVKRKEQSQ